MSFQVSNCFLFLSHCSDFCSEIVLLLLNAFADCVLDELQNLSTIVLEVLLALEICVKEEFLIRKSGGCFFLIPIDDPWALLRQSIGQVTEDISFDRDQPMLSDIPEKETL